MVAIFRQRDGTSSLEIDLWDSGFRSLRISIFEGDQLGRVLAASRCSSWNPWKSGGYSLPDRNQLHFGLSWAVFGLRVFSEFEIIERG
jgi:hypothetical protein